MQSSDRMCLPHISDKSSFAVRSLKAVFSSLADVTRDVEFTFGWRRKQRSLLAEKSKEKRSDGVERKDTVKVIKERKRKYTY